MDKTFFKTQKDISEKLISTIDSYWNGEINENEFLTCTNTLVENNQDIIFKKNTYGAVIKQRLGKKRICLLDKVLNIGNEAR
ncbi:TIGR04540 family protein [Romboutsia lituseburensis]|uniref:TIGR04540 family protein n=1 Tax=Romboutsia lituseburensis TaxID=1537 RepID=UPI00215AE780|nr:TIGR04540 family protein [Romboutsia lituseburensis]MCR8747251.1 TIGR04540 family protein [Romboutsia lituseburensis]